MYPDERMPCAGAGLNCRWNLVTTPGNAVDVIIHFNLHREFVQRESRKMLTWSCAPSSPVEILVLLSIAKQLLALRSDDLDSSKTLACPAPILSQNKYA
jgi:hypothetical protein